MAETVGFEPTNHLHDYFLSREAPSTGLGHVSGGDGSGRPSHWHRSTRPVSAGQDFGVLTSGEIIDSERYPIDDLDGDLRRSVVDEIRRELADDGCAVLGDFLSPAGLDLLLSEAADRSVHAYYSPSRRCNVYLGDGDPEFPAGHPRNVFMDRTNGFVTADRFGSETGSWRLYHWEPLMRFIGDCLAKTDLYIYDDPISNMIVNVTRPGELFNWHFDTNEFTITMLLRAAERGGHFEYVPALRNPSDECYDDVGAVLNGERYRVKTLDLNEGDLQIFLGRFSLHQVTANEGDHNRLLLIMSFSERPGMIGSLKRVKDLYGKTIDAHTTVGDRVRADQLLD